MYIIMVNIYIYGKLTVLNILRKKSSNQWQWLPFRAAPRARTQLLPKDRKDQGKSLVDPWNHSWDLVMTHGTQ